MNLDAYQIWSQATAKYKKQYGLEYTVLGLAGEAGEVANEVKRMFYQDKEINFDKVEDELGDVLWYVAAVATEIGKDLSYIAERNLKKLEARHQPKGV